MSLPRWLQKEMPFDRTEVRTSHGTMSVVDDGPRDGTAVLLVHGNPTWSYLWRKVIRALDGEVRIVAPDLLGFGASDKPLRARTHQLEMHVASVVTVLDTLHVKRFVAVGQDWGGPIACGAAEARAGRVAGLVLGNTAVLEPARPFRPKAFHRFSHAPFVSDLVFRTTLFPVPIMDRVQGERRSIGWREKAAYAWPFLRPRERSGPLALARMVPNSETHPTVPTMDRIGAWVASYGGPASLLWGTSDPILGRGLRRHRAVLPQATVRECDAGHFSQEEVPDLWAAAIRDVLDAES